MTILAGRTGSGARGEGGVPSAVKCLAILELVAERGGMAAGDIRDELGYSLPTVYRLAQLLVEAEYLVHLREGHRFELGYKVHRLGRALHHQIGVSAPVRDVVRELHETGRVAAYFAVYRGADVVVAHVVDSPRTPRIRPLEFGFHEATHATAFGKIVLANLTAEQRDTFVAARGLSRLTEHTIVERAELERHLDYVRLQGIAWERGEFVDGHTCAAVGVRGATGEILGAVAFSVETARLGDRADELERLLRVAGARVSRILRGIG
ncbi:IclR family transcriptional regulator [Microbacterium marinilacus]|uniref:IclR family transcriptional regulator n=1 Tax=Microbacterium marinilacus TaxID=415209 RepID=UPI001C8EB358|nr:IclR family transcriptional regulator C-terminal domain-containing protein [Microbacterium marinilacus]MBY0687831.1 helix-turn-helix domain-containing protein [Microbacterium marinilacus]